MMTKINSGKPMQELELDILKLKTENILLLIEPIKIIISSTKRSN